MSRPSTPLWQICLSTFWSSWGALVFYRERGSGRQPEQFMNSSQGLIPYGGSDTTTSRSKQDQLLWCILNLIRNTAFVGIVEAPWACYCCIVLDSFPSPFLQSSTCFDTCARGMPIKKTQSAAGYINVPVSDEWDLQTLSRGWGPVWSHAGMDGATCVGAGHSCDSCIYI